MIFTKLCSHARQSLGIQRSHARQSLEIQISHVLTNVAAGLLVCLFALATLCPTVLAQDSSQPYRTFQKTNQSVLFRRQYQIADLSFCTSQICVDFDGDGRRELLFASRRTKQLQMLNAADGSVVWSKKLGGASQSISAYDLDGDGDFEILYSVSGPGRLYVLDHAGNLLRQWDSGDSKLGNSTVIVDADGDGKLDGLFGSRSKYLLRLNMADLTLTKRRSGWVQCGCQTTAMDVDRDGRWDFFAGSGDDSNAKGVLHRYDPVTLKTVWSYKTNDNASSADPVLVDIDGDGQVEIIKSVDNYAHDDAHDAIFAFETDGTLIWKTPGFSGEDSPNVADLDGDGEVEIVGMTFGGEVYCLDAKGRIKWRKDLRPELSDSNAHAYMTPILCDLDGDDELEILAMTNGGYFNGSGKPGKNQKLAPGIVFALSADGKILDRFEVGGLRYWGSAYVCNVDDDPYLELVVSGSGGMDVIETKGLGPNTESFQCRRNYQRLNVLPWSYEDSYFIYRGEKKGVVNLTDNLVLAKQDAGYRSSGSFTTELLTLPPDTQFDHIAYKVRTPKETTIRLAILDASGKTIQAGVQSGSELSLAQPVRLHFQLSTTDSTVSPVLDAYRLSFRRQAIDEELILEVKAGASDRERVPVSLPLPKSFRNHAAFKLTRIDDGELVDTQLDGGKPPRLVWLLRDKLQAGQTRRYRLTTSANRNNAQANPTPHVDCRDDGKHLIVKVGDRPVLQYNHAVIASPDPKTPYYARSGHIHPVFTPAGKQVTDDFPPDHAHQHGIMLAWANSTYEKRAINFWDQKAGTARVEHAGIESMTSGPVFGGFSTVIRHSDLTAPGGAKPILSETWKVSVFALEDGFLFDLDSSQSIIGESPLRINSYKYGSMAIRGNRQWFGSGKHDFLTSEGKTKKNGNHSRPRWVDLHGKVDGHACGVTVLAHPGNFRFPQPVRLNPSRPYFSFSPMVLGDFEIKPDEPYRSRYRYFVHDGRLDSERADRLWRDFAHPPVVRVVRGEKITQ